MHKYFITLILSFLLVFSAMAQNSSANSITTKKGKTIELPTQGSIAVGLNAVPYIDFVGSYMGNMLNGSLNNSMNVASVLGQQDIYAQYYINNSSSVRLIFGMNCMKDQNTAYVQDDAQVQFDPNAMVEDLQIVKNCYYQVELSYLRYLNNKRWRPYYGGTFMYLQSSAKYDYVWGNEMTTNNINPTSTGWLNVGTLGRTTMYDSGTEREFGLGAFFGTEYYISTHFSLGGEIGLYGSHENISQSDYEYEVVEQSTHVSKQMATMPSERTSTLRTTANGRLYMMFHF